MSFGKWGKLPVSQHISYVFRHPDDSRGYFPLKKLKTLQILFPGFLFGFGHITWTVPMNLRILFYFLLLL